MRWSALHRSSKSSSSTLRKQRTAGLEAITLSAALPSRRPGSRKSARWLWRLLSWMSKSNSKSTKNSHPPTRHRAVVIASRSNPRSKRRSSEVIDTSRSRTTSTKMICALWRSSWTPPWSTMSRSEGWQTISWTWSIRLTRHRTRKLWKGWLQEASTSTKATRKRSIREKLKEKSGYAVLKRSRGSPC